MSKQMRDAQFVSDQKMGASNHTSSQKSESTPPSPPNFNESPDASNRSPNESGYVEDNRSESQEDIEATPIRR